jgi:hypothetical protein
MAKRVMGTSRGLTVQLFIIGKKRDGVSQTEGRRDVRQS